jgi:hypothetical protein
MITEALGFGEAETPAHGNTESADDGFAVVVSGQDTMLTHGSTPASDEKRPGEEVIGKTAVDDRFIHATAASRVHCACEMKGCNIE